MQPNKKYVAADGYQYAMYPNPVMNITQSINGQYSHQGTNAIDDAQNDTGISTGYAPCDMVCVGTDYVNANCMFWQSTQPVHTSRYGLNYIFMCVAHDDTADAYVGLTVKQGGQLFQEGTAGYASGNHNHIEVGVGQWSGIMYQASGYLNAWGGTVYMLPGSVNPADVFFVDDTQIYNAGGLNWTTTAGDSSGVDPIELLEQEDGVATLKVDQVRARLNGPTGEVAKVFNSGDRIPYNWKYVGNGHRYIVWKDGEDYLFLAVTPDENRSTDWADFSAPDEKEQQPENEPQEKDEAPVENISTLKTYGVDVSVHNGSIDLSGNDFVIIRASYATKEDESFRANVKKCEMLNIPYGVYVYDYAYDVAGGVEQAEFVLDLIKDMNVTCGVWFDQEDADGFKANNGLLNREHITSVTNAFLDVVSRAGYYCGVYSTPSWFNEYMPEVSCNKWIAHWNVNDGLEHDDFSDIGVMHQYTSVPLDKNVCYVPLSELANPSPAPSDGTVSDDNGDAKANTSGQEESPQNDSQGGSHAGIGNVGRETFFGMIARLFKEFIQWFKDVFNEDA